MNNNLPEGTVFRNIKRFKGSSVFGKRINFPFNTEFIINDDGYLCHKDKDGKWFAVCHKESENAYNIILPKYPDESEEDFQEKASLYKAIKEKTTGASYTDPGRISAKDDAYNKLFADETCYKFRKLNDEFDHENWNWDRTKLQEASLEDLRHMWDVIKDACERVIPINTVPKEELLKQSKDQQQSMMI